MTQRDAIPVSEIQPRRVEWLWRERIPKGMLTVIAGQPDQGKGLFACLVAAEVTKAGGNVLYSAIEDDPGYMTAPRLKAAGAKIEHVLSWRFILPTQLDELEDRIVSNDVELCVIDPLAAHLGGGVSRHSDNIRSVTSPLSELAEHTGCAFLIVEHALKRVTKNTNPLNAIGGTGSGLPAAARMAYLFGCDPKDGDKRLLCPVKSNLREKPLALQFEGDVEDVPVTIDGVEETITAPYLVAQDETEADASILLGPTGKGTPGRPPDKRAAAAEWLTRYLLEAGKPVKAGTVFEDAKQYATFTGKTVRRAADDMGVIRNPAGGGPKCTWSLPPELVQHLTGEGDGNGADPGWCLVTATVGVVCIECGGNRLAPSSIPGLSSCSSCGKLQAAQVVPEVEQSEPEQIVAGEVAVPDSTQLAIGWRAWGIDPNDESATLMSVTHTGPWTPRQPMEATCDKSTGRGNGVKREGHEVPDEQCSCGLYSAKTLDHLMSMTYHRYDAEKHGMYHVIGKVKLWGKVIEGSQGWRAQIGYPSELFVPFEAWRLAPRLERAYGVPVRLKNILRGGE